MKKRGIFTIFGLYLFGFLMFAGVPDVFAATCPDEWTCTINSSTKTAYLTKYNGTAETYQVPAKMIINDIEYSVVLGNSYSSTTRPFAGTSVKHLSVEPGVQIKYLNNLFLDTTNIETVDLTGADTSSAASVYRMFMGATNLKKVVMSGLDLSKVTSTTEWFRSATNIEEVDFSNTDMSKVTAFTASAPTYVSSRYSIYYNALFYGASNLKKINFNNFNTASLTTAKNMFRIESYYNPNNLADLDVTNWNTANVTSFESAFQNCANLTTIKGIGTLNTSSATSFASMFNDCWELKELPGIGNWNTANVTTLDSMFADCHELDHLDLSKWNTSNVTTLLQLFLACESLADVNVSTWDTSKVRDMNQVFKGCGSLEVLDLSNWSTESLGDVPNNHMYELLSRRFSENAGDYQLTPLKEITLGPNFRFGIEYEAALPGGYWHLKEGTEEQTSKKFTPNRLYHAYNNGTTPGPDYDLPHTYVLTELDPAEAEYYALGYGDNNTWEVHYPNDKFKSYCINLHRGAPSGYYDRTKVANNSIIDEGFLDSNNYGWDPLGSTMEEALITLIYFGYNNNASGIQEKYNLTDSEYMMVTQNAIWNFTDRYNNKFEYTAGSKLAQAYDELVSKRFTDIPNRENLKLFLYESVDGKQNLLSISGLSDVAHAGVRVLKLAPGEGEALVPLFGAEFTIYNDEWEEVAVITSDENGYATKYNTDSIYGLPEGIYRIYETQAPRGYIDSNDYYTFIVRPEDDNEIITVGKLKGRGDDTAMIFENKEDETIQGGGVTATATERKTGQPLMGARYQVLDEDGEVVAELTTDVNGFSRTSKRLLELNKKYTVKEIQTPAGYKLVTDKEAHNVVVAEDGMYFDTFFKYERKQCSVSVQATKKFNQPLSDGLFQFELVEIASGKTFATASNQADGKINFNLNYTGADLGFASYTLREVNNKLPSVTYDTHTAGVTVTIVDEGEDELTCEVNYDYGDTTFVNSATTVIPPQNNPPKTPGTGFGSFPLSGAQSTAVRTLCIILSLCSILSILMCKNRIRRHP